jgi:hypothetical protein
LFVTVHLKSAGLNLGAFGSPSASGSYVGGASTSFPSSSIIFAFLTSTTYSSKTSHLSPTKVVDSMWNCKLTTAMTSPIFFSI